jgi:hypothetical protein
MNDFFEENLTEVLVFVSFYCTSWVSSFAAIVLALHGIYIIVLTSNIRDHFILGSRSARAKFQAPWRLCISMQWRCICV